MCCRSLEKRLAQTIYRNDLRFITLSRLLLKQPLNPLQDEQKTEG